MAVAASSSSWNYDVFINFRGEDTRKIFVGHLYRALEQKAIHTFIDSEELQKGNDLSKLLNSIEDSRFSIVVFSKNYASSTWCLKELVKILECMDAQNQIVVPVFYEVDPSHVRNLKGSFAQAFAKHEDDSNADREEVHGWKTALTRAADLSGWDSRDYKDDGELIEKIVEDTFHKLIHVSSSKPHGLVGMDYHLNEMYSLLGLGVNDVRFIGIWGMGGIGKTTIARAVYGEIASQFDHCCFLDNVKEGFTKKGTAQIQEDLLSRILKEKVPSTGILNRGSNMIMERLGKKKVLLVLDDLDDIAQFETLLGEQPSFGGGSRIILTTRYIQSLCRVEYRLYEPKCLSYDKAHELFMKYAFRTNKPLGEYYHLSRRAIEYAQGLPLALKVLGASLYNKSVPAWEDTLEKLKETPKREIQDVLRTSFDGLDPSEKNIFLDVACFFRGKKKRYATNILNICGFFPEIGLEVLVDKALMTIGGDDMIEMHDLLVEMGRKIGSASRLWNYEDISRVLTENTATEAVEAIILDLSPLNGKEIYLNTEAFVSMTKLRLLMIYSSDSLVWCKQYMSGDLKFLSHQLRLLVWHGCPLKSLPSNFQPLNLVELSMPSSDIEQLWEGTKPLGKLKSINLSDSHYLRKIPDCSLATNLETLYLNGCTSLLKIHSSVSALENLTFWSLNGCTKLMRLPNSIHLKSLKFLILSGCANLERFPEIRGIMEELPELFLDKTRIEELPSSVENLTGLVTLSLKGCTKLKRLPNSIYLKSLKSLILSGCSNLVKFPEISKIMKELVVLRLDETAIVELTSSINNLPGLVTLSLMGCKELKRLPSSIQLKSLKSLVLSSCSNLERFPEIRGIMKKLLVLFLDKTAIEELPSSVENLTGLVTFSLKGCTKLKRLPNSIHLNSLKTLILSGCSSLQRFPDIRGIMEELAELCLDETAIVELPSSIDNLPRLVTLSLKACTKLTRLPNNIHIKSLKTLILSGCSNLAMFPEIRGIMEELAELCLDETAIVELPSSIDNLPGLVTLSLKRCKKLERLPSSILLKSLKSLILSGCSNLERFPEIRGIMKKLQVLSLDKTAIEELPQSIENFIGLFTLNLKGCTKLKRLPNSIHLNFLKSLNLSGCSNLQKFPEISGIMKELAELRLDETAIVELPSSIINLLGLATLNLKGCTKLTRLPNSIHIKSLKTLILSGCTNFSKFPEISGIMKELAELRLDETAIVELPSSIINLPGLVTLDLKGCTKLMRLPNSIYMKSLKTFILSGCSNLAKFPEISEIMKVVAELRLDETAIVELPSSIINLPGLVTLDLKGCTKLTKFPEIRGITEELVELYLDETAIVELPSSIDNLPGLVTLSLKRCKELKRLPSSIHLKSLKSLIFSGCSNLERFPEIRGIMKKLLVLFLDKTAIEELPSSVENLTGLVTLSLKACTKLTRLPNSIHIKSLKTLILSGCSNLAKFSEIRGIMEELAELCLDETAIVELPSSIDNLPGLVTLSLKRCKELKRLPSSIHLKSLKSLILSGCSNLERFPEIRGIMKELPVLCLDETGIEEMPSSIEKLTGLVTLSLKDCRELKSLPISICQLKSLEYIILSGCSKFEVFPIIVEDMEELRELHLDGTSIKELSPSIERLKRLIFLNMRNCRSLVYLPDNIFNLCYLTGLTISGCPNIYNLPENCGNSESLLDLEVDGSGIKQLPSWSLSCDVTEEMTPPFPSRSSSSSTNCLVGMVSHINQMELLLRLDQVDIVRFVGICGVGGIGKTTIASAVYDKIACQFEYRCFLENVKEGFTKKGETQMRKELLSRFLTKKVHSVGTLNSGSNLMMENLGEKKILLVLDDVDDIAQIDTLLGQQYSFGGGSRIIVTTRDKQILSEVNAITYCPGLLRPKEALLLFRQFAFRTIDPSTEYRRISRHAIEFTQGLPLALKVLGAFLYGKSLRRWEGALEKLKKSSHLGVQHVLRTSFDGLHISEKSIILDVACFFKGMKRDYAVTILQSCVFFPKFLLRILIDTSLIAITHGDNTLKMHDLVQDMSWEIICQENVEEPGKRSRLWRYDDVHHVLTSNSATHAVQVITLDLSNSKEVYLNARAFDKMVKLRLLQILDNGYMDCKQHVNGDLKFLSRELRCLIWHRFPQKSFPSDFHPENLVDLDMCFSCLEQLWEGTEPLRKLQFINLSHSLYLRKTCDMTEAPRLKKLILEGCTSLFEVHSSIWHNDTLVFLNLKGCRELKMFPSPICMRSLRTLYLSGCSNLEKFPEISEDMMELSEIDLDDTAIKELPSSIGRLQRLEVLSLRNCRSLVSLPDSICTLSYLQQLYLSGCSKLYNLPENLSNAQALTILEVQGSGIEQLPFFMRNKETVREGVIRVSGEGTSSELGVQVREEVNLIGVSREGASSELGVQVEECSEAEGILGALCSCLSCLRELFHRER